MANKKDTVKEVKATKTAKAKTVKVEESKPMTISDIPAELLAQIVASVKSELEVTPKEEEKKKAKKVNLKEIAKKEVTVRSVIGGVTTFESKKSGIVYTWNGKGVEEELTVDEVKELKNAGKFLTVPWLVVDDEEVAEAMGLTELYENIALIEDVDSLLKLPIYEVEEKLNKVPRGYKRHLSGLIQEKISNGELRDIVIIRQFEKILNKTFLI